MSSMVTDATAACRACPDGPGSAGCILPRMAPKSAYSKGCKDSQAQTAASAAVRENRAKKRAQKAAQGSAELTGGWDTPDVPAPVEPTGETCSECGGALLPVPGRAALTCSRGHFAQAPGTILRASAGKAERKRSQVTEAIAVAEPTPEDIAALATERGRFIRQCQDALNGINTTVLREVARLKPGIRIPIEWNPEIMYGLQDMLASYIAQARAVQSQEKLYRVRVAAETVIYSHAMNSTLALVNQSVNDTVDALNRQYGRAVYVAIIQPRAVPRIGLLPQRVIRKPPAQTAIAAPIRKTIAGNVVKPEDDYEDDDYEDDDYEDDEEIDPW